jgi:PAS domain S-box-containing protein
MSMVNQTKHIRDSRIVTPILLKLILALFCMELVIDASLTKLLPDALPLKRVLLNSVILALASVPVTGWWIVRRPVLAILGQDRVRAHAVMVKLVTIIALITFVVEFAAMAFVPYLLVGQGGEVWRYSDAFLFAVISTPLLWLVIVRTIESRNRYTMESQFSARALILRLFSAFFAIEIVCLGILEQLVLEDNAAYIAIAELLVEPALVCLLVWWFVLEPLRRLAVSENIRYNAVSLQMVDAVIITDEQGMILSLNPAAEDLFGYVAGEMEGEGVGTLFPRISSFSELVGDNRLAGPASVAREVPGTRRNGTTVPLDISVSRVAQGDQLIYMAVMRDNSERKRAEENVQHTVSLLEATLEASADGILAVDTSWEVQIHNSKFAEMMMIRPEPGVPGEGTRIFEFLKTQAADPGEFAARVEKLFRQPERADHALIALHCGRVVEWYSKPQWLGERIVGRVWSFRDVTARIQAEQSLRESEERFRQVFEHSEDAIILFDPATCAVIDVNPTAETIYGFDRREIVDRGLPVICRGASLRKMEDFICGGLRNESFRADAIDCIRKDGSEIIVSVRGKVIRLQGTDAVYCTFRDITERVRLEREASSIQAKLIHTNKMTSLGIMATSIAHEINNPNNYILANAQLLESVWHDADAILEQYLEHNGEFSLAGLSYAGQRDEFPGMITGIREGSDRIREIVSNLREFASQGASNMDGLVDCNKVVSFAVTIMSHLVPRYTSHFSVELAEELPPVKGNAHLLEQVVLNLIMNALQSLPGPDRGVWVSTGFDRDAGVVSITVRDEGAGMTEAVAHRIMEPFFTTKLDRGGSGLGLSISQSIISEHGGTLDFRSERGKGTTFVVSFPVYTLTKGAEHDA